MKVYVIDLESVPTRYTCEWKGHIPALLSEAATHRDRLDVEIVNISGGEEQLKATPGAFLNFAQTNVYKNNQLTQVAKLFSEGKVLPGDQFIFTDAWNPAIIQLKYMSQLLDIPVVIHALWHAGSYDPQDFLGRLIKDKRWTNNFEKSIWHAVDYNWFATQFHIDMFFENVFGCFGLQLDAAEWQRKSLRTGWPMEYMTKTLDHYKGLKKRNLILFPHRLAPEKQPEMFRDLAKSMPQYEWIVCQDEELTKNEYHKLLGEAKIVLSLNLQETLGISCFEGAIVDAHPLVPDRLSYMEMYNERWKYPEEWATPEMYPNGGKELLMEKIEHFMENYGRYVDEVSELAKHLQKDFFAAGPLLDKVLGPVPKGDK
jgi:hypothetical protein